MEQDFLQLLRDAGLHVTKTRRMLLDVLAHDHGPHTVEQLFIDLQGSLDRVTIYRSLASFEKLGFVRRCDFGDGTARFELAMTHHHHVMCRVCHRVESVHECVLDGFEDSIRKKGYTDITHTLEFFAICARCQ